MRGADAKEMCLSDPSAPFLAACGGDTVKIFDLTVQSGDPCALSYTPTPGSQVNSVKWNHTNQVVASSGDDRKITLWRRNGKSMGTLSLTRGDGDDLIDESISAINFCNKGSRYLCSGGSGRIVRIWDLQKKLCIKKLSGHTDTITGVMYNCKDEHLASISLKGDLILHGLASGSQTASLKDPNGQALRVLDYSRYSRQFLVTAGDDGSVHLWDTTGRSPKVSWLRQHSAPTTDVCFSPTSDKIVASVGLDKKLYTFDSASKRPTFIVSYEAPFSSLAYRDDGYILAAGTNSGRVVFYDVRGKPQPVTALLAFSGNEAVTGLCWQRSKPEKVENNCSDEIALLGSTVEDSVLMPDPLPSVTALSFTTANPAGSRSSLTATNSASSKSTLEETPMKVNSSGSLTKLQAPRFNYNLKDDMDVFSPLVDVQPITPSLSNRWDDPDDTLRDGLQVNKKSGLFPSVQRFPHLETSTDSHTIRDWRLQSTYLQDDATNTGSQSNLKLTMSSKNESTFSFPPPETRDSNTLTENLASFREGIPSISRILQTESASSGSKFAGLQDVLDLGRHSLKSSLSHSSSTSTSQESKPAFSRDTPFVFPESLSTSDDSGQGTGLSNLGLPFSLPRRSLTYAERISASTSFPDGSCSSLNSPKAKKLGTETRAELTSLFSRQDSSASMGTAVCEPQRASVQSTDQQQGLSSFSLQLIQRTLEETLGSVQKSIHDDVRNVHVELIRQFHMHEKILTTFWYNHDLCIKGIHSRLKLSKVDLDGMSNMLNAVLEKQDEMMKEIQSLRRENQQLRQLLQ